MTDEEQLAREARLGRYAAWAAFGAIAFTVASIAYQIAAIKPITFSHGSVHRTIRFTTVHSTAELLLLTHHQPSAYVVGIAIGAVASPLIGFVLWYLYQVARARRPEAPAAIGWLVIAAASASAIVSIISQIKENGAAKKFAALPVSQQLGKAGDKTATHLAQNAAGALQAITLIVELAFALGFVFVCIQAMRTGLLSRAMGYFGAFVGIQLLLPITGAFFPFAPLILEIFWLGAVGALFLGRWQGGRGPAWSTVEPIPWPTAADRRAELEAKREGRPPPPKPRAAAPLGGGSLARRLREATRAESGNGSGGAATAVTEPPDEEPADKPHPRSKKRKRKRRG